MFNDEQRNEYQVSETSEGNTAQIEPTEVIAQTPSNQQSDMSIMSVGSN